jgi:hypothetical protein
MDHELISNRLPPSTTLQPQSPQLQAWIIGQLAEIAVIFGEEITPERYRLMSEVLMTESHKGLAQAFEFCKRQCKYFPRPADVLERIERKPKASEDVQDSGLYRKQVWLAERLGVKVE